MDITIKTGNRAEQHYVAITKQVSMQQIPTALAPLIPEVAQWLASKNIKPAGPPFFSYRNMQNEKFDVEVGFTVNKKIDGDEKVKPGKFEAGNYAVATHFGPYSNLPLVHGALAKWAKEKGIKKAGPGTEFYVTDPAAEPDQNKWQTDIAVRIQNDPVI